MDNINGRKINILRLSTTVNAPGFGNVGPVLVSGTQTKAGFNVEITKVVGGVVVNFGTSKAQPLFVGDSIILSGSLLPEGPTADKAVVVSRPAPPTPSGNPFAAGVPGNSGGGMGQGSPSKPR
jgi:hypothetical protein